MNDFERPCSCAVCGRHYVVRGTSVNPQNETQVEVEFACACGAPLTAFVPGSINRERLRFEPVTE